MRDRISLQMPILISGRVVRGFARGSNDLNMPTANIDPMDVKKSMESLNSIDPNSFKRGVYYGFAQVLEKINSNSQSVTKNSSTQRSSQNSTQNARAVFPMVASYGFNPFYGNKEKSLEVHILHNYKRQFYGAHIKCAIMGWIRPERSFPNAESMMEEISRDIDFACAKLINEQSTPQDPFFNVANGFAVIHGT